MASTSQRKRPRTTYQVFLSFRGADTRQGFTDILYHTLIGDGINVFRDDEEIENGDHIGEKLLSAIKESRIFVPILSRGYASSKWCLVELAKMVDAVKEGSSGGKKIIPIFYDVGPDDVKLKTDLYGGTLTAHEKHFGSETVQQWKEALKHVGQIKGWKLKEKGYAVFAEEFTQAISEELKVKQKYVTGKLVQRSDQQDALINLLDVESSQDVRFVWIHGMGGIGKTTLATAVFNRLCDNFDSCSFLLDVRETTERKGIEHLQKQLLRDLRVKFKKIEDEKDGIKMISEKLQNKKVMIVLDDVSGGEQIAKLAGEAGWFGYGSRIIITSRSTRVHAFEGRKVVVLEAKPMESKDSLLLFSRHAFEQESPPYDFRDLSEKVITITGGLPLALEVIGSQLRTNERRDRGRWIRVIDSLEKIPAKTVIDRLKISFDALDWDAKEVFLDIACFFINEEKTKPIYMWQACGFEPDSTVEELVERSLVKILDNNKLWMHDQLRDLGRKIVRDERSKDPKKAVSRIWKLGDARKVLQEEEGKENVEMLCHRTGSDEVCCSLKKKELKSFKNLRFLDLYSSSLEGDAEVLIPKLMWLSWHCADDTILTVLCWKNLVVLDLSRSRVSETWTGWGIIGMCKELKVLDLSRCNCLIKTPNLSMCPKLERLILQNCIGLVELDHSIGTLKCLKYFNANFCPRLKEIPEELCCLDGLEKILMGCAFDIPVTKLTFEHVKLLDSIGRSSRLKHLPVSIGRLSRLTHLRVSVMSSRLPESLGDLKALEELDLSSSLMAELPESIGGLVKLDFLSLHSCSKLKKLPCSIGNMKSLAELHISKSGIVELPDTIGNLQELKMINMRGSKIKRLPDTIGNLLELKVINMRSSEIERLPSSMGNLKRLERVDARFCKHLVEVPPVIMRMALISSDQTATLQTARDQPLKT